MKDDIQDTIYKKVFTIWACIFFFGFGFGIALIYISSWFIIPFFAVIVVGAYFLKRITCPNCGHHLIYERRICGIRVPYVFMRPMCKMCGSDFDTDPKK